MKLNIVRLWTSVKWQECVVFVTFHFKWMLIDPDTNCIVKDYQEDSR
jgi:hypothetical protein